MFRDVSGEEGCDILVCKLCGRLCVAEAMVMIVGIGLRLFSVFTRWAAEQGFERLLAGVRAMSCRQNLRIVIILGRHFPCCRLGSTTVPGLYRPTVMQREVNRWISFFLSLRGYGEPWWLVATSWGYRESVTEDEQGAKR